MRHSYPPSDANPVLQYHGVIIITITIIIIIIIIITIIIIIFIINSSFKCWFDSIIYQVFYLKPQAHEGQHASLLGGDGGRVEILAGNYIIRDSSVFTYIESTFRNM